jgi:hypothetical protein
MRRLAKWAELRCGRRTCEGRSNATAPKFAAIEAHGGGMKASRYTFQAVILLAAGVLAGCAAGGGASLDGPQAAAVQAPREFTLPEARVAGGDHQLTLTLGARPGSVAGAAQPQLRVEIRYVGVARIYDSARDTQGKVLRTERGGGEACKAGAPCVETVRIELPDGELRQAKGTGFRLKIFARSGPEIEIGIPGPQIGALYERIDGAGTRNVAKRGP